MSLQASDRIVSDTFLDAASDVSIANTGNDACEPLWEKVISLVGAVNHLDEATMEQIKFTLQTTPEEETSPSPAGVDEDFAKEGSIEESEVESNTSLKDVSPVQPPQPLLEVTNDNNASADMDVVVEVADVDGVVEQMDYELVAISTPENFLQPTEREKDDEAILIETEEADSYDDSDDSEDGMEDLGTAFNANGIDIRFLASIIDDGEKATAEITDKSDVVLVLGCTGVGKSTFMQLVAGKKIIEGYDESLNVECFVVEGESEAGFEIGNGLSSKTSHVRSYLRASSSTYFVDSSGYGDTRHIETDIATSVCIRRIAERAGRLRFVILLNANTFFVHRAGELRNNLDLVAKFVGHNFVTFKQSFTFLFSHCTHRAFGTVTVNDTRNNEDVLNGMRQALVRLLNSLKKETKDESLKKMIKFLRDSINTDTDYCDVFHPFLSDIDKLIENAEPNSNRVPSIENPSEVVKCSLSATSRMSIAQVMVTSQEDIASKLEDGLFDDDLVRDVRAVFTLAKYIEGGICQGPAESIRNLLTRALLHLKDEIFKRSKVGSDGRDEEHAKFAKAGIDKLGILEDLIAEYIDPSQETEGIDAGSIRDNTSKAILGLLEAQRDFVKFQSSRVDAYISSTLREDDDMDAVNLVEELDLRAVLVVLQTMEAWAKVFEGEIATAHQSAQESVHATLVRVAEMVLNGGEKTLSHGPEAVRVVAVLREVKKIGLFDHIMSNRTDGNDESQAFENVYAAACANASQILSLIKKAVEIQISDAFLTAPTVVVDSCSSHCESSCGVYAALRNVLAGIDLIDQIMEKNGIQRDLGGAQPRRDTLEVVMTEFIQRCDLCVRLVDTLDAERGRLLELCFQSLRIFANSLPASMRVEGHLEKYLEKVHCSAASQLRELSGRLKQFCGHLDSFFVSVEPAAQKQFLDTLRSCAWLDSILQSNPAEQTFLVESIEQATNDYHEYGKTLVESVTQAVHAVTRMECDADEIQGRSKVIVKSAFILEAVSFIIDANYHQDILLCLRTQCRQWSEETNKKIDFTASIHDLQLDLFNKILLVADHVKGVDAEVDRRVDASVSQLCDHLENLRPTIDRIVAAEGEFESKARLLESAAAWSIYPRLLSCLPSREELRQQIRTHVIAYAEAVQRRVEEANDTDVNDVEQEVAYLLEATKHIDLQVDGEASRRVDVIMRIIETRRDSCDTRFQALIDENDFPGVQDYITSLKKDQRRKKHYHNCLKALSTALWQRVETLRSIIKNPAASRLQTPSDFKSKLQALENAEKSVGSVVKSLPPPISGGRPWSLVEEGKITKKEMKEALERSCKRAAAAIENLEFVVAFEASRHASLLEEHVPPSRNLPFVSTPKKSGVHDKVAVLLMHVDASVDDFLEAITKSQSDGGQEGSFFSFSAKQTGFPPETIFLRRALFKLQAAVEQSYCPEEIMATYDKARTKLSNGLNDLYRNLQDEAKEGRFARPLKVLCFLREELIAKGVKEHVKLEFDVNVAIADVTDQKNHWQQAHRRQDLFDDRKLEKLSDRLNYLYRFNTGWYRNDYNELCHSVSDFVSEIIREILLVIKNLEFDGIRAKFAVTAKIQQKLQRHLTIREPVGDTVKAAFLARISSFFQDLATSLETGNMSQFEILFLAFHTLMATVPPPVSKGSKVGLLTDFDRSSRQLQHDVHHSLLEFMREKLRLFHRHVDSYQYEEAGTEGQRLRSVGYFLGSMFQMYKVQTCSSLRDNELDALASIVRTRIASGRFLEIGESMAILRLSPGAAISDVEQSFRQLSLKCHPDKNPQDKSAKEKFIAISRAKECLDEGALQFYNDYDFPFLVDAITTIPRKILAEVDHGIQGNDFEAAERICDQLDGIPVLAELVRDHERVSSCNTEQIRINIFNLIRNKANALCVDIEKAWVLQNFIDLHHSFSNLESLEDAFKGRKEVIPESLTSKILAVLISNLKTIEAEVIDLRGKDEVTANRAMNKFASDLIRIGKILDGFPRLKKETKRTMFSILNSCQSEPWGVAFVFKLGLMLENGEVSDDEEDTRVGRVIVNSFPHFQDVRTVVFNREVITAPVQDSIKLLESKRFNGLTRMEPLKIDEKALETEYELYERLFNESFTKYVQHGTDDLVNDVYLLVHELGPCNVTKWNNHVKKQITRITAGVFATFTIIKSGDSFKKFRENTDDDTDGISAENLLFRPHNIQVLAILRLLGVGDSGETLPNHIMEVRTGEGKSIILGALSVVLALLGFSVRCVCYSEHLSERDNELFQDIFVTFGVGDRIVYSKITTMSEDSVASKGDIRQLTLNLMKGLPSKSERRESTVEGKERVSESRAVTAPPMDALKTESCPQRTFSPLPWNGSEILLVDEVDVFFGPDFYGKTYNQIAELEDPKIENLIRKLWTCKVAKPSFLQVQDWSEYKEVIARFRDWSFQIEIEVRSMCADVQSFREPKYEVDTVNSRIGYSRMDSVDWDVIYGYRTAFAFLHEFGAGRLRGPAAEAALKRALCLRVSCGQFSYARISPTRILGVSGTLRALTVAEKEIVRQFGVDRYSFLPSVYSKSNLIFDKAGRGIVIEKEKNRYLQTIASEINCATRAGRSVIVFFENDQRLLEFQKSPLWRDIRHGNVLSSTSNKETRNYVVKRAATSGQVTISTAAFGRGTDFFCKDSKLEDAGGMLVIQAFLSVEKTEEVQIKGRTARQGKKGSYMLVLLESDLCTLLQMKTGEWESHARDELYGWLDRRREAVHEKKLGETVKLVEAADECHQLSHAYLDALVLGSKVGAKNCLDRMYEGIKNRNKKLKFSRMVCLSDATGSMSGIWSSTKNFIREMLRRIDELGEGHFELLWVAYRDYSDGSRLLEKSTWTRNPKLLENFVSRIDCGGGGDYPEAVEWALREVNEEHEKKAVTRALLIADAPPHYESKGGVLVDHNDHVMATDYKTETERLKQNRIPVYTFTLTSESSLVSSFRHIASSTGGEWHALKFDGSEGANKDLIDCVCETALEDIGGSELLAEYKARKWN